MDIKKDNDFATIKDSNSAISAGIVFDEAYIDFLIKKTEKFVTAVYLISNLINDTEPIKWQLRRTALSFIGEAMSLNSNNLSDRRNAIKDIVNSCKKILTIFDIARFAGIVSEMNWKILKQELEAFISNIELKERVKSHSADIIFPDSFFSVSMLGKRNRSISDKFVIKDRQDIFGASKKLKDIHNIDQELSIKDKENSNVFYGKSAIQINKTLTEHNSVKKTNRKDIIISILKNRNNLTIKDFADVIKDCSEKTIQRELLELLSDNVLKKEGERRWTRYSLK